MKKQFYERLTKYFAKRNHLGKLTGANCLWGNYLEGNYPVVIIRETIIQKQIAQEQFSWGQLSGGGGGGCRIIRGPLVWGVNYPGGDCLGAIFLWGNCVEGNCMGGGAIIWGALIWVVIIRGTIVLEPKFRYDLK